MALRRIFEVYFPNIGPFVFMTAIAMSPVIAYSLFRAIAGEFAGDETTQIFVDLGALLVSGLLCTPLATAMVVYGVFQQMRGRHATFGDALTVGFSSLFPVLGVAILQGLAVGFGWALCIIPGVILAVMFFVAVPAAVEERPGVIKALERSTKLTEGFRWHVFGVFATLTVIEWISSQVGSALFGQTQAHLLISTSISLFTVALRATAAAVVYYQLRSAKESIDIDQIATIFD